MAPVPTKRRKVSHDFGSKPDTIEDASGSDHSDLQDVDSDSGDEIPSTTVQPHSQVRRNRAHEGDSAIYAAGDYKSSLFKLQVDELLEDVQPDYEKRLRGVDEALRTLKGFIESIEEREPVSIPEAINSFKKSKKITIPFPDPKPDPNAAYKLGYEQPSKINVVGSYVLRTLLKSDDPISVDMVVLMPSALFQDKDYLDYRYFYKRAYYLACIAAGLQDIKCKYSLSYDYLHGNSLLPILILKSQPEPTSKSNENYNIRVITAVDPSTFAESKLRPDKNCIRPRDQSGVITKTLLPTPFYNASIRTDCTYEAYLKLLHQATKHSKGFRDACVLGKIWLRQRGFGSRLSKGGFGHFEWNAVTALLLQGGGPKGHSILSPGYSSYQTFKAILQFFATHDLVSKPFVYKAGDITLSKSAVPVLFDGERGHNILYKMTSWSYALLREESRTTLQMLNDSTFDSFEGTFIFKSSYPLQKYDCLFRVTREQYFESKNGDHMTASRNFSHQLFQVLQEGLTDRVKLIGIGEVDTPSWPTNAAEPLESDQSVLISLVFDPANMDRLVDHGPAAEEKKKAAKFQNFWGDKAELRRFKDGSILESLIWSPGSVYAIFREIVSYLLKRHFSIQTSLDLIIGEGFEKLLPEKRPTTTHFDALMTSFRTLEKQIRDLESLPLQLRHFSAASPQLRYSSIESPSCSPRHPLNHPADVLIQFEGSGRWPDDIVAIQRTKIAFLLKIGSLLEEVDSTITTRVGLENEEVSLQNCAFLDIIYENGASFRLRIHHDREQTLLEKQVKDKGTDQHSRDDAVSALSVYKRTFIQLPLLNQSITTHCTRFPLLSPTIRLVKIWFDRHMLMPHVSEELIELLVARTFLQPYPWATPSSVMTGFLRTLQFISKWDWRIEPLVVDFTGTMKPKDLEGIKTRLEAWRKIDPGMIRTVIFAASNHDPKGTAFTDKGPSKMIAARMTALARSACKLVKEKGLDLEQRALFAASLSDYDFVIHLSSKFTGHSQRGTTQTKFKNLEIQSEAKTELVGYAPVQLYIQELEKLYGSSVILFHGSMNGSVIAGLWNAQTIAPRGFKVNLNYATKVVGDGEKEEIVLDKEVMLAEMARLGGDMVARIEVK